MRVHSKDDSGITRWIRKSFVQSGLRHGNVQNRGDGPFSEEIGRLGMTLKFCPVYSGRKPLRRGVDKRKGKERVRGGSLFNWWEGNIEWTTRYGLLKH